MNGQDKHSVWFGTVASEPLKHFCGFAESKHWNPIAHSLGFSSAISEQFVPMGQFLHFIALIFELKVPGEHGLGFDGLEHSNPTAHSLGCSSPGSEQFVPIEQKSQFFALRSSLKVPAKQAFGFAGSEHW